ncbi:uncharacterized protein FIBRA_06177 [Fibroporia radiculosa]|uniref:TrmE-type G domain-containing protein n=1 Tax=Fibroporia radiculosa TaxID=599839 RepID=J4GSA7_9APHY|nr:uncharacterized protein FIBRA_06177 [Fibroporia radiculosa]CCM04020.1 predicted protein [Fibroporia radiculosa]
MRASRKLEKASIFKPGDLVMLQRVRRALSDSPHLGNGLKNPGHTPGCTPQIVQSWRSAHSARPDMHRKSDSPTGLKPAAQETDVLPRSDAQRRTIYALSTPPGKAGVAVIRISGPDAQDVWRGMVKTGSGGEGRAAHGQQSPEPWKMHRCRVVHPSSTAILDDGLAVLFVAPKSFTTEDVLELHIHSGRAVISSVLAALSQFPFTRPAEPGEFTRRAFEGGRLDLTQVEGLKDLINAETESQRRAALMAAGGASRNRLERLRQQIIKCLSLVEALIDFSEDEDIEDGVFDKGKDLAEEISQTIRAHLSDSWRGEIMRSGVRLAIFGPPNAGKSSLLNFLAQREAAIVTPIPGTTRDVLELSLDVGGLPVVIADTAGIRKTTDHVESIGVERAKKAVESADVALCVLSLPDILQDLPLPDISPCTTVPSVSSMIKRDTFVLFNKTDMVDVASPEVQHIMSAVNARNIWPISLTTGEGADTFLDEFARALRERYDVLQEDASNHNMPLITNARQRTHLESALRYLEASLSYSSKDVVLAAEELRYAVRAVGKISGHIDTEDILDAVFREFCIGK